MNQHNPLKSLLRPEEFGPEAYGFEGKTSENNLTIQKCARNNTFVTKFFV